MRSTVDSADSMEEAGGTLLDQALDPRHWMVPDRGRMASEQLMRVGSVDVCARVDVTPTLDTFIRVSFRGPELSPMQAAEFLEQFISRKFPFVPNSEWFVEIDARKWIHFSRRYTQRRLVA